MRQEKTSNLYVTSQLYLLYYGKDMQGVNTLIQCRRKKESKKLHISGDFFSLLPSFSHCFSLKMA